MFIAGLEPEKVSAIEKVACGKFLAESAKSGTEIRRIWVDKRTVCEADGRVLSPRPKSSYDHLVLTAFSFAKQTVIPVTHTKNLILANEVFAFSLSAKLPNKWYQAVLDFLPILKVTVEFFFKEYFLVLNSFCYDKRICKEN